MQNPTPSTSSSSNSTSTSTATTAAATNPGTKIRTSCDRCQAAKLKCNRAKPSCGRCAKGGHACLYSPFKRIGRPPKSAITSSATSQQQQHPAQVRGKTQSRKPSEPPRSHDAQATAPSLASQSAGHDAQRRTSSISASASCDATMAYDNAISPEQLLGGHTNVSSDLDMMMHLAGETSWSSSTMPHWPVNMHTSMDQLPMLDQVHEMDQLNFGLPAAMHTMPKGQSADPTIGLPSPAGSQISMTHHSVTDHLANTFLWEADLFGGVGIPLPTRAADTMRATEDSVPPLTRRGSPADSASSDSLPTMMRMSVSHDNQNHHDQMGGHGRSSTIHSPVFTGNSSPSYSAQQPHLQQHHSHHSLMSSVDTDSYANSLPIRSGVQHAEYPRRFPSQVTPPCSGNASENGDCCKDECYSALLAHVMRLVERNGGEEVCLDALLSMNRELIRRREYALRCPDCCPQSAGRATMILIFMALNNLVSMFEQKLNIPRNDGQAGINMEVLQTENLVRTSSHSDARMMAGGQLAGHGENARFLHELISLSLDRMVVLLTEMEREAHSTLKDASYGPTRAMLRDLPRRIFFMKGKLAMA